MKKNFLSGLITGICSSLLIIAIAFAIPVAININSKADANGTEANVGDTGKAVQGTEASKTDISYEAIVRKLMSLEKIVNEYYLDDTSKISFVDGVYKGFISSLGDPYSTYFTADEYKALLESSSGVYCGIGCSVNQNVQTGIVTIVKPFKDSPAYKSGLLPGDIIVKVDDEDVTGLDLSEVVSRIKGVEGTTVKVSVMRDGEPDILDFVIKRQKIENPTVEYKMLEDKIGYIIISEFDEVTVDQFRAAVDDLERQGMKSLIVDVRNNPGGLLDSVVNVLDRLLPPGLIVYTQDKYNQKDPSYAKDEDKINVPMAVLINGNSASASEIFAGTLQDYKAATIIGTTSFGKGIVQMVIPLTDGTAVKLTVSKYYTPNGRNIHKTGIKPDIEVELDKEMQNKLSIPIEKDNQLQEAIKFLKEKTK